MAACAADFSIRPAFTYNSPLQFRLLPDWQAIQPMSERHSSRTNPRCAVLRGTVGGETPCGAYGRRLAPCRELQAGDEKCLMARARHGLPPVVTTEVLSA